MGLLNFYNKTKKSINDSSFYPKNSISFQAYELLKKYVVNGYVDPTKLDNAYPKNTNLKVLKNVSQRSMKTFYKLSDKFKKDKNGVLSQVNLPNLKFKKKLSAKAKLLLKQINNDQPRYQSIDILIKKISNKN
jgi:hypothetical protein